MFRGRLAGYLGWSTEQIETRMSIRELNEWRIREQVEPYGERREDIRIGLVVQILANINRPKSRKNSPYKIWEVYPLIPQPGPPTTDQLIHKLQVLFNDPDLNREHGRST